MSRTRHAGPPRWPYGWIVAAWLAGSALLVAQAHEAWQAAHATGARGWTVAALWALVAAAQSVALFYLIGIAAKAASYVWSAAPADAMRERPGATPPQAVLYLTAGDFDAAAVDSLLGLETGGPRLFVLHDDGDDEAARARMRAHLDAHPRRGDWEIAVWHRPKREGGKAGAVNWVLARLDPAWELLLLCDSDSIALQDDALLRVAGEFQDPAVAAVQCRNAGWTDPGEPAFQSRLASAIDVFDALAAPQAAWGYLPFFGHNAVLRIEDLRRMGGLTPGFFSDDLDLSVRLTLAGRRIVYRGDVAFAERHPSDWLAFRKRARKWAFGCMQVIRRRARAVVTSRGVPFAHRVGLLEFMGFYPAQALLVAGLIARQLVLPWLAPAQPAGPADALSGAAVALALFAPTLAWSVRARRLQRWPELAWMCALVYGGSILATARGVLDGLSRRDRPWIPTNLRAHRPAVPPEALVECAIGGALAVVPWAFGDPALGSPATYLFVATLLFAPLTAWAYREPEAAPKPHGARGGARAAAAGAALLLLALVPAASWSAVPPRWTVAGPRLERDHAPFVVRGVHYSPWGPGTGPDGRSPYPGPRVVDRDLAAIASLGANTIVVHGAPGWVVAHAWAHGLCTLYAFDIAWNDTSRAAFDRQADQIVAAVDSLRGEPGVVGWLLGHEVPDWVERELGAPALEARLRALAARVRERDPDHLLGHGNWPPTRDLDLSFLDLACFNLYPAWPYEVAVRGYGPYLREVLAPLARGKPLIVTEFGINTLEASEARQSQVLADCWREVSRAPSNGGVLFEWCDEWWKNYDNPIHAGDYWHRRYDPTDAARHDDDPEEYYGIVSADRSPKPALAAVRRMWHGAPPARPWWPWAVLAAMALATALAFRRRDRSGGRAVARVAVLVLAGILAVAGAAHATAWFPADSLNADQHDSQYGWTVAGVGRVAGDPTDVVAVGAHFESLPGDSAAGAVFLYRGGQAPDIPAWWRLNGISPHEHFGEAIAGGFDVDGDGQPDMVVGAPLRSSGGFSSNGAVDVFRGGLLTNGPLVTLTGEASDDWFGQSVAVGDLDGDGRAEIIVGAPYNDRGGSAAGAVFIYRGGSPPGASPWKVLVGEASNDQFGWSVAYAGDVDGDGYGDVVVGARLHGTGLKSAAGRVYLFRGGPAMGTTAAYTWDGEAKDDWFGNSVAGPGDVDGGGRADVLVGAPYNDRAGSAAGAMYLFRGESLGSATPAAIYTGEIANAQFGWSVAGAGDVNADGRPDLLAGARLQPSGALAAAGRAYLFAGGGTLVTSPLGTADGENANDWFGNCVSGAAFFTSTRSAIVSGAPYDDTSALNAGRAFALATGPTLDVGAPVIAPAPRVWPNPARGRARIVLAAPPTATERVLVSDVTGRGVRTLEVTAAAGAWYAEWDGRDEAGRLAPPGLYLVSVPGVRSAVARLALVR